MWVQIKITAQIGGRPSGTVLKMTKLQSAEGRMQELACGLLTGDGDLWHSRFESRFFPIIVQ